MDTNTTPFMQKMQAWEAAWARYIEKKERLDELRAQGRYGYQLRMPKLALKRAAEALEAFN